MRIIVFVSDDPVLKCIAESWCRNFRAAGHASEITCHPVDTTDVANYELAFEIGARCVGCNVGVPFIHYIYDPLESIPGEWIDKSLHGHLFFFADEATRTKAHKQGVRTAEYLPVGFHPNAPRPEAKVYFDFGHFGNPTAEILEALTRIKASSRPDIK